MRSINKVILVGHLAADPEQFQTKTGKTGVTFPIATHRDSTSDGVKKEVTDYHRVVCWGKLGEICAQYLSKGQGVYVEGVVLNRAYEADGERKYVPEIRADEVNMLTWKRKGGVSSVNLETVTPSAADIAA
jgi:single-strand DNA-binding protein